MQKLIHLCIPQAMAFRRGNFLIGLLPVQPMPWQPDANTICTCARSLPESPPGVSLMKDCWTIRNVTVITKVNPVIDLIYALSTRLDE